MNAAQCFHTTACCSLEYFVNKSYPPLKKILNKSKQVNGHGVPASADGVLRTQMVVMATQHHGCIKATDRDAFEEVR